MVTKVAKITQITWIKWGNWIGYIAIITQITWIKMDEIGQNHPNRQNGSKSGPPYNISRTKLAKIPEIGENGHDIPIIQVQVTP
jgi:hypothetical protein